MTGHPRAASAMSRRAPVAAVVALVVLALAQPAAAPAQGGEWDSVCSGALFHLTPSERYHALEHWTEDPLGDACNRWAPPPSPWCATVGTAFECAGVPVEYEQDGFRYWYDPALDSEQLMDGPLPLPPSPPSGIGWRFVASPAPLLIGEAPHEAEAWWSPNCQAGFVRRYDAAAPVDRYRILDAWWTSSPIPDMPECQPYPGTAPPLGDCGPTPGIATCISPLTVGETHGFCYWYDAALDPNAPPSVLAGWRCVAPPAANASCPATPAVPTATDLSPLLPTLADVPEGMVIDEDGASSVDAIAATFSDPADAAEQLVAWGWRANAYRFFDAAPGAPASTPRRVEIALQQFAWPAGAAWALPYFAHGRAVALGQDEPPTALLQPDSSGVLGPHEATRYVRVGTLLVRVTVVQPDGALNAADAALGEATNLAMAVVERAGLTWPGGNCR